MELKKNDEIFKTKVKFLKNNKVKENIETKNKLDSIINKDFLTKYYKK